MKFQLVFVSFTIKLNVDFFSLKRRQPVTDLCFSSVTFQFLPADKKSISPVPCCLFQDWLPGSIALTWPVYYPAKSMERVHLVRQQGKSNLGIQCLVTVVLALIINLAGPCKAGKFKFSFKQSTGMSLLTNKYQLYSIVLYSILVLQDFFF